MVVVHMKDREGDEFLYETTVDVRIDDLIEQLVSIHNLRIQAKHLVDRAREYCSLLDKATKSVETDDHEVCQILDIHQFFSTLNAFFHRFVMMMNRPLTF
jgi:hypothetical protein